MIQYVLFLIAVALSPVVAYGVHWLATFNPDDYPRDYDQHPYRDRVN